MIIEYFDYSKQYGYWSFVVSYKRPEETRRMHSIIKWFNDNIGLEINQYDFDVATGEYIFNVFNEADAVLMKLRWV